MKRAQLFLVLAAAALFIAAQVNSSQSTDLTVHEWGTFTSVAGQDGTAIDWNGLGCRNDLPAFVNDAGYRGFKWSLLGTVRMETPVIYFYSSHELAARVNVRFPRGVITEWYPRAENAIYERKGQVDPVMMRLNPSMAGLDTSLRTVQSAICWNDVQVRPGGRFDFPAEKRPSHYYAARGTDAAPISVGEQHEKFLFYRGVGRFQVPLATRISSEGKIAVENHGPDPIPVILFENRGGHVGYRTATAATDAVLLDPPRLDGSVSQLRQDLENALTAHGLFPKEAHAMVETWQDSWFEEGSRVIYLMPQRAVDEILPLQIEPAPVQIQRVFVGRMELFTPASKRAVEEAALKGDTNIVNRYGRFLEPILDRISSENPREESQIAVFRQSAAYGNQDRCK